jgi:ABC-2 type transport system ATP-binding protein
MSTAVECVSLSKSYGKVQALKNINLTLEENKIYGLLGRNGAGKTTLLNLMATQIMRTSGEIKVFGEENFENSEVLSKLCLVKDKDLRKEDSKVSTIFNMASILYPNWDENYKEQLVKEFRVDVKKKYKALSRGNKSMVGVIIGLASKAKVTIFDEPSVGLDAAAREKFYNLLLQEYENSGRTFVLSTHLIDEASSLFENIIIINNGEILLEEEQAVLLEKAHFLSGKEEVIRALVKDNKIIHKEVFGGTTIVGVLGNLSSEQRKNLSDNSIEISAMPLQKLFIYLTEESSI